MDEKWKSGVNFTIFLWSAFSAILFRQNYKQNSTEKPVKWTLTNILRAAFFSISFAKKLQTQSVSTENLHKTLLWKEAAGKNIGEMHTSYNFDNFTCCRRESARNSRHLVFAVQRGRRRGPVLRLRRRRRVCRPLLADERDLVVLPAVLGVRLLPGELGRAAKKKRSIWSWWAMRCIYTRFKWIGFLHFWVLKKTPHCCVITV